MYVHASVLPIFRERLINVFSFDLFHFDKVMTLITAVAGHSAVPAALLFRIILMDSLISKYPKI